MRWGSLNNRHYHATACAPSSCLGKAPSSCLGKGPDYRLWTKLLFGEGTKLLFGEGTQLLFGEGTRLQPVQPALVWGRNPTTACATQLLFGEETRLQPVQPALVWGRNPTTACAPSSCSVLHTLRCLCDKNAPCILDSHFNNVVIVALTLREAEDERAADRLWPSLLPTSFEQLAV